MRRRRPLLVSLFLALGLGGLVAIPFAPERNISLDVWLAVTACWIVFLIGSRLLDVAPLAPSPLRAPWRRRREAGEQPPRFPRDLVTLEGTLLRATGSPRLHGLQLRPRLQRVVAHQILHSPGIHGEEDLERVSHVLSDLTWMVDPEITDRAPTIDEVDQLLRRLAEDGSQNGEDGG